MQTPQHAHYDLVVIGAGMVGLSLALAFQHQAHVDPAKILLLESRPISKDKALQPGFDARSTVLSYGTVKQLQNLNLWQDLHAHACPIKQIHVSDKGRFGNTLINAEEEQVSALGYVLENQHLGQVLNNRLLQSESLECLSPVDVLSVSQEKDAALVHCRSEEQEYDVRTSLVVLAEGGRSGLIEKMGIVRRNYDYQQAGIIANIGFEHAHEYIAYERFTGNGPLAILPLNPWQGEQRAALIWTQGLDKYQTLIAADDEYFLQFLQSEFGYRLGELTKVGERAGFPFMLQESNEQIRHRLVLLGNAAHTLHPVAGQGFNLAFRDALCLAANIAQSLQDRVDPGAYSRLQAYLLSVEQDQDRTINFSHYLTRLFSTESNTLSAARKMGLIGIDLFPALKKTLSLQAMGLGNSTLDFS